MLASVTLRVTLRITRRGRLLANESFSAGPGRRIGLLTTGWQGDAGNHGKGATTDNGMSRCKQQVAVVSAQIVAGRGMQGTMAVGADTVGTIEAMPAIQTL
jgi:hypothetical protein